MKFIISFIENILRIKKIGQINLDFLTLDYACFHYDLSNLDKDEYNESEFLTATFFAYLAKQIHNLGRGKIRNFLTQQLVDWVEVYTLIDLVPEAFSYEEYKKKIQNYEYYGWLKGLANASGVGEPFLKRMKIFNIGYQLEPIGPHSDSVHPKYYEIEIKEGRSGKYINTWFSRGFEKYLIPTSCYAYFKIAFENYDRKLLLKGMKMFSAFFEQSSDKELAAKFKDPGIIIKMIKTYNGKSQIIS